MNGDTLKKRVMDQLGDDILLPSSVNSKLQFCSDKLEKSTTVDEFDEILKQYSLLDNKLNDAGMLREDFKQIINDMRKEL